MNRDRLKILGFYVLAALIIARVVITPLQHSLADKKNLLAQYEDTYKMRMLSFEKYKVAQEKEKNKDSATSEEGFLKSVYGRDVPYSELQSEVVEKISALAEKQGLTLLNFEFGEPAPLKSISEVPVVLRVDGVQKGVIALLREMEKDNMKLTVKRFDDTKNGPYSSQCSITVSAFRLEK